jgi:shikimate dehydrogenase
MVGIDGTPLASIALRGAAWAFDAVYTPVETGFLRDAAAGGLAIISGYELFFQQGIDAWRIFTELGLDAGQLRTALQVPE